RSTREVLGRWLRSWGMHPKLVSGGPQAIASLREESFALAVIDAGMDGLTPITGTRVVYLGAIELPETQARFRQLGGDARVAKPVMREELQAAIFLALEGLAATAAVARAPQGAPRRLRILVGEDNELNVALLQELLRRRGHDAQFARDGRAALDLAMQGTFDLLLLDLHMPELDGFEVVRAIRDGESGTDRHLRIIALTARSSARDRERCLAAGV